MVNWEEIRNEFPVCKKMVYLNPAGGSPVSESAANEGIRFYREMLEFGDTYWDEWLKRTETVRDKLAHFINAEKEEIAFTTNTSHGMNLIAHMLYNKGTVITMRDEFPSSTYPWLNLGIEVKFVEPEDGIYSIKQIEKSLTPDVKILVSSYVQYRTGFRQDLEELAGFCQRRKLIFVLNATQALGIFPVDVKNYPADFLTFTGLKWLTAGYGIGGLYINRKWLADKLPFAGWRSVLNPGLMDNNLFRLRNDASVLEAGCSHFPNIFALGGALDLFNRIGKQEIFSRIIYLTQFLRNQLEKLNLKIVSPSQGKHLSGITIVKINNPEVIVQKLKVKGIFISARGEGIRVSVSIFNNEEDIFALVRELKILL